MTTPTMLNVVAPLSVRSWYQRFAGVQTDVMFVGEEVQDAEDVYRTIMARAGGKVVRILSGHDSLLRDWVLADKLRARGVEVVSQSGMATAAALDKVLQKRLLGLVGAEVPTWGLREVPAGVERAVWKGRASTQSRDVSWSTADGLPPSDGYWEEYVDGVEYSVVLHRDANRTVIFPPVWKGRVEADLSPPWLRLRTVPSPAPADLVRDLARTSARIADVLDAWGFVEVEFIVPLDRPPVVTDINPRICGTMRIVAMATGVQIFDPEDLGDAGAGCMLASTGFAAEVPYDGAPFANANVVATSRLTCAAATPGEVRRLIAEGGLRVEAMQWPEGWSHD